MPATTPRSIEGIQHGQAVLARRLPARPGLENQAPLPRHFPSRTGFTRPFQRAPAQTLRSTVWSRLQLPLLIAGSTLIGFFVQSLLFGIVVILLYGVLAFMLRVPSQTTFLLAFMALITVVILLVARPNATLAGNFATYTFLLLVTGVIALAIEARPPKRRNRHRRPGRG